jgi:nucleotide-binding universal stress UspA family protein
MNTQEPRQEHPALASLPAPTGLRGVLVLAGPKPAPHVLERAALLPLAPGARVAVLATAEAASHPMGNKDGSTWPPGAMLEARVRAVGGQLLRLGASEREMVDAVERYTAQHGLELVVLAREPDSLRSRLFGSLPEALARHASVPMLVSRPPSTQRYQRILVGTDFSPVSRAALELALRLSPPGAGRLGVFHAYDTSYALTLRQTTRSAERLVDYYRRMQARADASMREFLAPYRGAPVDFEQLLCAGDPPAALHEMACEQEAQLVVVGRNEAQGAGHVLLGSVAETTLRRRAPYDVLCVPGPTPVH